MEKKHERSVPNALICVKSIHKGISCKDNLLHLCRNFDSIHNWNGILSIDSLLKIAKTTRTKIKTTDALPCQCIWMSPLWRQPHTQAGVEEVFSCSFCLRRLAMPEWWGQTIRMPRLFCFTFNLNLKPMSNYYCENCGHRFADVRQLLTATCSQPSRLQQPRPPQALWRHWKMQSYLQTMRSHILVYHANGRWHLCISSKRK